MTEEWQEKLYMNPWTCLLSVPLGQEIERMIMHPALRCLLDRVIPAFGKRMAA